MKRKNWRSLLLLTLGLLSCSTSWAQDEKATESESDSDVVQVAASSMKIKLRGSDMELSGTPIDLETITVNSLFGEAKLPMHTVAGVRFAQRPDEQTTIVLQNGDVITGELGMESLKLVADWGEATVNIPHIETIVFRSDLVWTPVNVAGGGTRWRLTKVRSGAAATEDVPRFYRQGGN